MKGQTFDYATASMAETLAEAARREALRAEGKPLSGAYVRAGDVVDVSMTLLPIAQLPKRPKMNKTETRYADRLATMKACGEINAFAYEVITLKLGDDVRYTPDFLVTFENNDPEIHEVKGAFIRDDARVKLRVAATLFPMFRFKLAQFVKGVWSITPIDPR